MANVVYGLSGDGSGHSSRSREIASHLVQQGHDVRLVSYNRGYRNLKDDFNVFETEGLLISSIDNKVSRLRTVTDNLKRFRKGNEKLRELKQQLFKRFRPDVVITDFEPMTAYLALHYDLPLVTIDNQHRMRYIKCERPPKMKGDCRVTKAIIRAMVPFPDVSLVITFFLGELKNDRTFLFPPILRREILATQPAPGNHVLVYLTSGFESLLDELKTFSNDTFLVYGYDRSDSDGVLQFRAFSRDGFLHDLASAKAVIATAGFTLISEALYLRKPYLALPMKGQYEQELNAFQLQRLGYGINMRKLRRETIGNFLYRLPEFAAHLQEYHAGDNSEIKAKLDELLANDCALAKEFHGRRR